MPETKERWSASIAGAPTLVVGAIGVVAVGALMATDFHQSPSTPAAVLLIIGCWLVIAALARPRAGTRHEAPVALPALLAHLIAGAVFGAALVCTAAIAVFGQTYGTARLCFALVAVVAVPAAVVWTFRARADAPNRMALSAICRLSLTAAALIAARLAGSPHTSLLLTAILMVGLLVVSAGIRPIALAIKDRPVPAIATVPVLLAIAALAFAPPPPEGASVGRLCVAAVLALLAAAAGAFARPAVSARWRGAFDVFVLVVIALAVFQIALPYPYQAMPRAFNMNYFLGPMNDAMHGKPLLVDTFAQYGVGIFYVLGLVFLVLPVGYGTFSLLLAAGTSLMFACMYLILRFSIRSQVIAAAGVVAAAFIYIYSVGKWQYQVAPSVGVLRFGIPWLVILCSVRAAQTSGTTRLLLRRCTFVLVGVAAAWSAETGMYTLGCTVAMALVDAAALDAPLSRRLRTAGRQILLLVAAAVAGVLVLSVSIWVFSGHSPEWGPYISFVRLYTTAGWALLPIQDWSQGIAVGVTYGISATLIVGLLAFAQDAVRPRLVALQAIAGITVMGALEFSYFLGRAAPSNLIWVSPPAVVLLFLWLGTAGGLLGRRAPRAITAGAMCLLAALAVLGAKPYLKSKFHQTALGSVVTGRPSLSHALDALWVNPIVVPQSVPLTQLIESRRLASRRLALVAYPPAQAEALLRAGRANDIESTNSCQSSISATAPVRVLDEVRQFPTGGAIVVLTTSKLTLTPLQEYELKLLRARFNLQRQPIPAGMRSTGLSLYDPVSVRRTWTGGGATAQPAITAAVCP